MGTFWGPLIYLTGTSLPLDSYLVQHETAPATFAHSRARLSPRRSRAAEALRHGHPRWASPSGAGHSVYPHQKSGGSETSSDAAVTRPLSVTQPPGAGHLPAAPGCGHHNVPSCGAQGPLAPPRTRLGRLPRPRLKPHTRPVSSNCPHGRCLHPPSLPWLQAGTSRHDPSEGRGARPSD